MSCMLSIANEYRGGLPFINIKQPHKSFLEIQVLIKKIMKYSFVSLTWNGYNDLTGWNC